MTNRDGGPAYPVILPDGFERAEGGMTMRQYYKAVALQGLLASGPHDCDWRGITHDAALYADAMLDEDSQHEERTHE